jgi:hypothetical protein
LKGESEAVASDSIAMEAIVAELTKAENSRRASEEARLRAESSLAVAQKTASEGEGW